MKKYFQNQISLLTLLLALTPFFINAGNISGQDNISESQSGMPPILLETNFSETKPNSNLLKTISTPGILSTDVVDSVIYTQSGTTYKEIYTYNSVIKILTSLKQISQGGWVNYSLSTFTYDDNGNLLNELYENWDKGSVVWVKDNQKTSIYDDLGNKLIYLYENWDAGTNEWIYNRRYTKTYDVNGNQLTYLRETWNTSSLSWTSDWLVTFTYDESGNMLTQLWDYNASNMKDWLYTFTYDIIGIRQTYLRAYREPYTTEWLNYYQYLYTYDTNGNLLIDQSEFWDMYNNIWLQSTRWVYTYDSVGNLIEDISEIPINNTELWKGSYRSFYTYNESSNLINSLTEKWNSIDSVWTNYSRAAYDYNDGGNLILFSNELWTGLYWNPNNKSINFENNGNYFSYSCEELTAFYSPLTGINEEENSLLNSFTLSQNYPNPFNPATTISYRLSAASRVELIVYNVLGKKVRTLVNLEQKTGIYSVTFDGSGLAGVLYFYRLITGQYSEIHKMVLLK